MRRKCTLGIDIGATKTLLAVFDERLKLRDELKIKTAAAEGEKAFLAKLESSVRTLRADARKKRFDIAGAGVGIPGDVDVDCARILACPNIPFLPQSRLHERLAKLLQRPVVLGNDCHLALFGEHELGAARGYNDVIGIFLGSGIGGALLIGGRVHLGASGCAGDLGHYLFQPIVLSNFVDFLNPELVLLGGGLVEAMPRLVRSEIRKGVEDHTTPRARKAVRVVVSKLKRHAVTAGAAKLAQTHRQRRKHWRARGR